MPQKYSVVKKEVDEFCKKNNSDLNKAFADGLMQVEQSQPDVKNMYLLAFMQNVINAKYHKDSGMFKKASKGPVNAGINWLNSVIEEMLVSDEFNVEAQKYLVRVATNNLLRVTDNLKKFGGAFLKIDRMAKHLNNSHPFPNDLHFAIDKSLKDADYYSATKYKYSTQDDNRRELLEDLTRKYGVYENDLEKMIPSKWEYNDKDKQAARKILLREATTVLMQEAITSGEEINSAELKDRVKELFGPKALESRGTIKGMMGKLNEEDSNLGKKLTKMSLPKVQDPSITVVGHFRPLRDDKQASNNPPIAFTLK